LLDSILQNKVSVFSASYSSGKAVITWLHLPYLATNSGCTEEGNSSKIILGADVELHGTFQQDLSKYLSLMFLLP
jgi:hypothetical protein